MAAPNAQTMATNWKNGMSNPATTQKYKDGINNTTVNPMALAASPAAQQRYANATALAVSSGRMANKLNSIDVNYWKTQSVNIGANQLSVGATKGLPKYSQFAQKFAPVFAQASQAAKAIPNDGSDAAISARVLAAIHVLKQAAGK